MEQKIHPCDSIAWMACDISSIWFKDAAAENKDRNELTTTFKAMYKYIKDRGLFLSVLEYISLQGDMWDAMEIKSKFFCMLYIDCSFMESDLQIDLIFCHTS